ncbi:hypothetical protein [Ferrimonas kyonanensis]|uniref:hypothetical protein n=1 Tax=Ferrimonas kyonanensis TaxID=364763 RepID=UPI0003FD917D|nr:hypothetical protein [Ferrimonas kyonanensis]
MRQKAITVFYLLSALLIMANLSAQVQRQHASSAATTPELRFVYSAAETPKQHQQNEALKHTVSDFLDRESELLEYYHQGQQ